MISHIAAASHAHVEVLVGKWPRVRSQGQKIRKFSMKRWSESITTLFNDKLYWRNSVLSAYKWIRLSSPALFEHGTREVLMSLLIFTALRGRHRLVSVLGVGLALPLPQFPHLHSHLLTALFFESSLWVDGDPQQFTYFKC